MGINCEKEFWLHEFPGALTRMSPREIIYLIYTLAKKKKKKHRQSSQVPPGGGGIFAIRPHEGKRGGGGLKFQKGSLERDVN